MQTTLTLSLSEDRLDAEPLPTSFQEQQLWTLPPIRSVSDTRWGHLLLGCHQASISAPVRADPSIVDYDVDDFDRQHALINNFGIQPPLDLKPVKQRDFTDPVLRSNNSRYQLRISGVSPDSTTRYEEDSPNKTLHSFQNHSFSTRTLTRDFNDSPLGMTTTISAPGSPPDLSGSRSSKSSSYCSSSQDSTPEGFATDTTHFEEIGLGDDKHAQPQELEKQRPPAHFSKSHPHSRVSSFSGQSEQNKTLPSLSDQIREAVKQKENELNFKKGSRLGSMKRGFTSPVVAFGSSSDNAARTRSASPPKRASAAPTPSNATLSADTLRPPWSLARSSLPVPPRRGSWQPHRRSVQELEAECHDSDDDLPDDASLWNVPVSPHPAGIRSHRSSFAGSPAREPVPLSPRPIPLEHAQTAPESPPRLNKSQHVLPRQRPLPPRSASLNASLSNPSSPRSKHLRRMGRANSWNLAMGELSEEARILSENLEHHAEAVRQIELEKGRSNSDESLDKRNSFRMDQIQLPPIQKGNLDFMPISKEKEAILSRTRPSWLPPKDPKEEKKHLKEYQRMMAASLEAEKKRTSQSKASECEKDDTRAALGRIWQYYSEETTDLVSIDKRVFDLCWRGVNPNCRGKVWRRAVGNPLGLTQQSYDKAIGRAKDIQHKPLSQLTDHERAMEAWFKDVERDAETAFPELNLFQRHGPLWQDLVDVCKAYAAYRSDIGYAYGDQLVAALILLQIPNPSDAFILLANSLNRPMPLALHGQDIAATARTYDHAVSTLAIKFPRLHEYLFGSIEEGGLGFKPELIFGPMLQTIFCNGLDIDRLCRVWDIWVFKGDKTLIHTAVAVLGSLQPQIFDIAGDVDLKRRNIQEMLAWGPFNRTKLGSVWDIRLDEEKFVEEISLAGTLDYRGR